jgi:hypothetical protein
MRRWFFIPPPGFMGELQGWFIYNRAGCATTLQHPPLYIQQEPIRIVVPDDVVKVSAQVESERQGERETVTVQFIAKE